MHRDHKNNNAINRIKAKGIISRLLVVDPLWRYLMGLDKRRKALSDLKGTKPNFFLFFLSFLFSYKGQNKLEVGQIFIMVKIIIMLITTMIIIKEKLN